MYYNGKIKWLPCAILLCCQYNCKQILTRLHDDVLVKCNLQSSFSFAFLIGKLFYVKLGSQRIPISQDYTSAVSGCPWRFTQLVCEATMIKIQALGSLTLFIPALL